MALIQELIHDHKELFCLLDEVRQLGVGNETGRQKLMGAKKALLAHLEKEDRHLYPKLKQASRQDPRLGKIYSSFASEMDEISRFAVALFEHPWEEKNRLDFARDFGKLYATLRQRISREESILYREFEKLST